MKINGIYCGDCQKLMHKMYEEGCLVDLVLTSPPYNTERQWKSKEDKSGVKWDKHQKLYDVYESQTDDEYIKWTERKFRGFDHILKTNGVVLYNLSYGNCHTQLNKVDATQLFNLMSAIINNTPFMVADVIIWKKSNALPNNTSRNKLTRICEFVFVLCRKSEYATHICNKPITQKTAHQTYYKNIYNFVEAKNNDGKNPYNQATYSIDLCEKLLQMYALDREDFIVFDPFSGTGTTAVACKMNGIDFIGCELSPDQCNYARERLKQV